MSKFEQILALLDKHGAEYELIEHEPAQTSHQAEQVTGWSASSGAKAIVFKLDDKFVLVVAKGTNRVDFNKLRKHFEVRKARLATPEEVFQVMGVRVGSCYPFSSVAGVQGIVDETLAQAEQITFSPGTDRHHIKLDWQHYKAIAKPKLVDIVKD